MDLIQERHENLESAEKPECSVEPALDQQRAKDPLTNLPVELQNISFKSLGVLDKLSLKFVNRYFYAFIPQYNHADYLRMETLGRAKGKFYACHICCRFRPRAKFADNARIKSKGPGADKARDRFCLECGLKPDPTGYTRLCRNTWVIINKEPWIVCIQCGNLGKTHKEHETNLCEDCWRLNVPPRVEIHANHVLPDPVKVTDRGNFGETWISSYTTPRDVVKSAMLVGISTPNAFAKNKKWDMNGGEGAVSDNTQAKEDDVVFKKKSIAIHPKLISGKASRLRYRQRYRLPFMTRLEARKERALVRLKAVADNDLAMDLDTLASTDDLLKDGDGNGGPGPSTLSNAATKARLAAKVDLTMDTDAPVLASVPQQKGSPAPALSETSISTAQEGPSQHPNPQHPAHIPIWAQMATSHPNSRSLNREVPTFIPRSAIQMKSLRHPKVTGAVHIPIWAREATTQEGPFPPLDSEAAVPGPTHALNATAQASAQYPYLKSSQYLSTRAQNAVALGASTADIINAKDQRDFAQPRFTMYDDMDLKPPCAVKVTLDAYSYSKKTATPITYNNRGNSGNIIAMNYLKARQALHQPDPNRKLGWYSTWTVDLNPKAEANSDHQAKVLASIRAQSDNSRKRRASDDSLFELQLRTGALPVNVYKKIRRIEEDSEEEFNGFSSSSSPKPVSESSIEELRAKALATMHSNNPKKRKASDNPDATGSETAFAHYNNQTAENLQKKRRVDEDSKDTFEGLDDSDSSWKGCED